ncbi:trihelix transcription factor ASIL2-like [Iris pallida]|uniref:Trihelix transcription factor ASIL2-like n=1 Tax=Iris pallida TaxID=29817 RepID=A0AAX6F903_IRIPA|nr:trihelix transcription factor ASIL2-like [Iris pallida]
MDGDDDGGGDAGAGHPRHKPPLRNYLPPRSHRRSPPDPDSDDSERNFDEDSDEGERNRSDNSGSSPDSRGKRRKLDRYTLGFEFAPRKPPTPPPPAAARAAVPPNPKPNASKNYAPDWSEDSTFVLLDAWGDLFVKNDRKLLRSDEWSEVAEKVNRASRTVRSESQCRNRIDTLKKKYKKEKVRLAEYPDSKGDWVYFAKMDFLMPQQAAVAVADAPPARLPCGVDAGEYVFTDSRVYMNRANGVNDMRDSPGDTGSEDEEEEEDESDGLPPATTMTKRKGENSASFRMLADSIKKFGDVYEKIEIGKRKQMAELERMRNEFQRDLEVQKRQIWREHRQR